MKKTIPFIAIAISSVFLSACQSTSHSYNGHVGYQIEQQTAQSATLSYTLSLRQNQAIDETKLQSACKQVLGLNKTYKLEILTTQEVMNTQIHSAPEYTQQIGQSRTSFGLSHTQDQYSTENYATRQALEAKPSTLRIIRYTCS